MRSDLKLFVDDIRNAPDDSWNVARSVSQAIRGINQFEFEVISLDHDISHQVGMGELSRPYPCGEDFATVAMFLALKYKGMVYKRPKIILHSANPLGIMRMRDILYSFVIEEKMGSPANRLEMET